MKKHLEKVNHDYIRYANCWEDADVLLEALSINSGDRVLSIGSAGDNSFSLLVDAPELVVAVDINPIQLQLIQLKKAAIKALDHWSFLQFMGFVECSKRLNLFGEVARHLLPEEQKFWANRKEEIKKGIIFSGKFERYFKTFHHKVLPFIHSPEKVDQLFARKTSKEQTTFFQQEWNTWRWRLLFKVFFSKFMMGRLGRDPQFLKEVKVPVSSFILDQAANHLSSTACQDNYFLQFILTGRFNHYLPHYAREENFNVIKEKIDQLIVFNGLAEDSFKNFGQFDKFNLSNIFEYMNQNLFKTVSQNLIDNGKSGARYAYWNLMVPRSMGQFSHQLITNEANVSSLNQKDKGFFYSNINLETKK